VESPENLPSIYDFPDVYVTVLARDKDVVPTEVSSLQRLLARHNLTTARILELACGACAHSLLLAAAGHTVTGVDRAVAMLTIAQAQAQANNLPLTVVQADVVDFHLPDAEFDCAIFMFETFPVITDYHALMQHFATVRQHVRPGGLYVIDLDARKRGVGVESGEWGRRTVTLADGVVETWNEDFPGDWVENTSHMTLYCQIQRHNGQIILTRDDWHLRVYSPWDLRIFVQTLPGWELLGFYSWRDLSETIADEAHYWLVLQAT